MSPEERSERDCEQQENFRRRRNDPFDRVHWSDPPSPGSAARSDRVSRNPLIQIKPLCREQILFRPSTTVRVLRVGREWIRTYRQIAPADLDFHREETLPVAALLALAGGYIDAYSWITHRVFANAADRRTCCFCGSAQWRESGRGHCTTFRR